MSKDDIVMTQEEYNFRNDIRSFMAEIRTDMKYTKEALMKLEQNGCSKAGMHERLEEKINNLSSEQTATRWVERVVTGVLAFLSGGIGGSIGK